MKHFAIAVAILLGSFGSALADHDQQRVLDGAVMRGQGPCTDNISGKRGMCQMFTKGDLEYLVFLSNDRIQFIRQLLEKGYRTIYVRGEVST